MFLTGKQNWNVSFNSRLFLPYPSVPQAVTEVHRQLDKRRIRVLVGMDQDEDTGFQNEMWVALITSLPCGCEKVPAPLAPPWEVGGLVKLKKSHETNLWLIVDAQRTFAVVNDLIKACSPKEPRKVRAQSGAEGPRCLSATSSDPTIITSQPRPSTGEIFPA